MTTDATRASAQAMPVTRRRALATTGAGLAAALSLVVRPAPAASQDASLNALDSILERHRATYDADEALWNAVSEIEDTIIADRRPPSRVQTGWLFERFGDGRVHRPLYAQSAEEIENYFLQEEARCDVLNAGRPTLIANSKEKIREQKAGKLADLAIIKAERKRIEDESGYTAAMDAARASAQAVRGIEAEILAFVPGSLAASARLAAWVCERLSDDRAYLTDDDPLAVLATIAKAM